MLINLNWAVAWLGCAALFLFWCWQRSSGIRGFLFTLLGIAIILGAVNYQQGAAHVPNIVGFGLAALVLVLLLLCLVRLGFGRRSIAPQYQAPTELRGRCSRCATVAPVKHYTQGWLCASCARRGNAQAA